MRTAWTKSFCATAAVLSDWLESEDRRAALIRARTTAKMTMANAAPAIHHAGLVFRREGRGGTGWGARAGAGPVPAARAGATSAALKSIDGLSNRNLPCALTGCSTAQALLLHATLDLA